MVREARKEDLDALLNLYLFLHEDSVPEHNTHLEKTWNKIIEDRYSKGYQKILKMI